MPLHTWHSVRGYGVEEDTVQAVRCSRTCDQALQCVSCQVAGAPQVHTQADGICPNLLLRSAASLLDSYLLGANSAKGMRKRQETSRFPAWVEDGATYSASEVFLDSLSLLHDHGPCLVRPHHCSPPSDLSIKPLPLPLTRSLASPAKGRPGLCKAPQRFSITCCQGDGTV